ncbi:MAG: HAD-IA family hydrolase [Gemmatimonadaceae bacterium]|nr:HAD-IA family hydrolase [Gemmatimonadaceae bacterium]
MRPQAILFDLDGTLIDSVDLIVQSARHAFTTCDEPVPPDADWLADLGMPLTAMFGRFGASGERLERLIAGYREFQHANHDRLVQPYEAVDTTLARLHAEGFALGIVTSKAEPMAWRGLELLGLAGRFDTIVGLESCTNHKPHPEPVETALARLGMAPTEAVFVGDSPHDMNSGRAAGVTTAAALWGPFSRDQIASSRPDWWLDRITDLLPRLGLTAQVA